MVEKNVTAIATTYDPRTISLSLSALVLGAEGGSLPPWGLLCPVQNLPALQRWAACTAIHHHSFNILINI